MKKYRQILLVFTVVVICTHRFVFAVTAQTQLPALTRQDAALIAEAYHLQEALADKVWPGWSQVAMPFIYITADYEYGINFPQTLSGFSAVRNDSLLGKPVQVRKRTLAANLSASFPFEGISAVVMGTPDALEKSPGGWALTAAHEMFHVLQAARQKFDKVAALKLGPESDASWQLNFPFPYKDSDVMNLIHLQSYPIYLAVTGDAGEGVKYNAGTAVEAIRVYKNLLQRLAGDDRYYKYSQFQEWAEGIAFYTEYKIAEAAAHEKYVPLDAFKRLEKYTSYQQVWADEYKGRLFLAKHAGRAARSRTAFYHLGLGKGLLLDLLMPDWKTRYFAPGVWIDDLLMQALGQPVEVPFLKTGTVIPDFNLTATDGEALSLKKYRGRVVVINFWETWCPPCIDEIPHLKALQKKYESQGLVVLGITSNKDQAGLKHLRAFLQKHDLNYPTLLDKKGATAASYAVASYPHMFVVNRNGQLAYDKTGYQARDEIALEKEIQTALATRTLNAAEIMNLAQQVAGKAKDDIWPGFDLKRYAALVTGPGPALIRFTNGNGNPESQFVFEVAGDYFPQHGLEEGLMITFHEAFHGFERDAKRVGREWRAENSALVSEYPDTVPRNNALLNIEGRLLLEALQTSDSIVLKQKAAEFLAIRHMRQAELEPRLVEFEKGAESNEGLAEYVGVRAVLVGMEVNARGQLSIPFSNSDRQAFLLNKFENLTRISNAGRNSRLRFYYTGSAQGFLLDRLLPDWKSRVQNNGLALQDLLESVVKNAPSLQPPSYDQILKEHNYEGIIAEEETAAAKKLAEQQTLLKSILTQEGQRYVIDVSALERMGDMRSFDPMNVTMIGKQKRIHTRMLMVGQNGLYEGRFSQPVVEDFEARQYITVVKPDQKQELVIDGSQLETTKFAELKFEKKLTVAAKDFSFEAHKGTIMIGDQEVIIKVLTDKLEQ
jgi:peroxiredoxin